MRHASADEAAFVELPRAQPQTEPIVYQHLHAIRAPVDEQIRMMSTRLTEDIHYPCKWFVDAGTHVERLNGEPGRIDADHFMSSRSSAAHSCAADAGHSTGTLPPRRRTSMRIALETGLDGNGSGTNPSRPSMATLGAVVRIAIGFPLRSACRTHRCNMAALSPRARGTAATETPGCWHAPTASAMKYALWFRRRRRPISINCPVVFT
jgi:hypothetical protein